MKDYRPISCCNVIYKVISMIIANRLKETLPDFISLNQSAFVKDRLLMENLLLATELVKDYHKESISQRCAIKIDISKAFDSVQWSFLLNTLETMRFPPQFIHWISLCVTTASFSVQVNGELAGFSKAKEDCGRVVLSRLIYLAIIRDVRIGETSTGHNFAPKQLGLSFEKYIMRSHGTQGSGSNMRLLNMLSAPG